MANSSLLTVGGTLKGLSNSMSNRGFQPTPTSLVKDNFSNKFYGNQSFDQFSSSLKSQVATYTSLLKSGHQTMVGNSLYENQYGFGNTLSVGSQAQEQLKSLQDTLNNVTADNYIQHAQVVESYQAHPEGWDKYFEAAYKSPREAEANASQVQTQGNSQSPLAIAAPKKISPSIVGTGIASTSSINPFGQLDSGLGV